MKSAGRRCGAIVVAAWLLGSIAGFAADAPERWPQFLGPAAMPVAADGSRIPDTFGPDRNVRWSVDVPPGSSSPIVWGDRLFLTGASKDALLVLAYDRGSGKLLWKTGLAPAGEEVLLHRDAVAAAPTPVTDGRRVYAYFGAYGLVALDMKGGIVWEKKFPIENNMFGTGTSPVLDDGTIYLVRDVSGDSAVHAFDAATGEERWTAPRPTAGPSFSTPVIWRHGERNELVVAGTGTLTSYDLADGKPIWWVRGITVLVCPSPVVSGDRLYFGGFSTPNVPNENRMQTGFDEGHGIPDDVLNDPVRLVKRLDRDGDGKLREEEILPGRLVEAFIFVDTDADGALTAEEIGALLGPAAPGENVVLSVKAGGTGDVTKTHVAWKRGEGVPYVASTLLHGGRLYYVKKGGFLSAVDPVTGKPFYEMARLGEGGEYYATPVGVGDRVVIASVRGTVFVVGAGEAFEVVARNRFDESIAATPAVVDDTLYLRTSKRLWAIGETAEATR